MKFTLVALTSLLALAAAQDSSSSTSDAPATTHSPTPQEQCLLDCDEKDVCCQAKCMNVPCPSDQQANDTNTCVSKCDQGDGSEADAKAYAECQAKCITTTYFPGATSATDSASSTSSGDSSATPTGSSDDDNDSNSNDDGDDSDSASGSESDSPSSTGSGDEPNESNAAVKLGASAAGLASFLIAAWAL
ncbi:uncharacterized protein APUU_11827S [Aspergillus puulaauensis]|uniref:Extracellular membrane protein CFEM domain-containing protein n=1 Tax=Aspergillus puulaauensis TaxID=1220207 RepID=A0A7R8AGU4_9EURO|nr:uncharacterized protein APUU_11827S [Aspergillus puulaauensis]BCS18999.1 hypothetical protein APUU_11827S [Aspergillus puulaauensis]